MRRDIATKLVNGPIWIRSFQHLNRTIGAMMREGHIDMTKPSRGTGRNMVGLTAAGAAHYNLRVDPGNLIEPLLTRQVKPRPKVTPEQHAQHRDMIAEIIAEGGTLEDCAPVVGLSKSYCALRWREIVNGLGPQAMFRSQ